MWIFETVSSAGHIFYIIISYSISIYYFLFRTTLYLDPGVHWINLRRESDFPHEQIKLSLLFMVSICQCKKIEVSFFFSFLFLFFLFYLLKNRRHGGIKSSVSCEQTPSLFQRRCCITRALAFHNSSWKGTEHLLGIYI